MRFGTIGTNFIAREFRKAGEAIKDFSITAVYSRRFETAQIFSQGIPGVECVTDLDVLAARRDVDAVYIASPNYFHAEQARKMLNAGKHVLLEKPACPDRKTFVELCELARENHVVLLEAMRPAFTPGFQALRSAVSEVGTVRRASFIYCQYSSRYDAYKRGVVENAFNPALCNGALMDIGVYCAHALISLFGQPVRVMAAAQRLDNGLDSQGSALCVYPGMLADLTYSKIADGCRQSEVQGEKGTLLIDSVSNPKNILFHGRDGTEKVIYHDPDPEFFGMAHEIAAFMDFAAHLKERPWEHFNRVTEQTLALLDEIRWQTGIDFTEREKVGMK